MSRCGGRTRGLQTGTLPHREKGGEDPDAPLPTAAYSRVKSSNASPSDAFQYEIVYDAFRADQEFWQYWKVVDCTRNSIEQGMSKETATIRVVLNLPSSQRLFPTAYTPAFSTLPFGVHLEEDTYYHEPGRLTWVIRDALPENLGEPLDHNSSLYTIDDIKMWCQEHPHCVGFAFRPETGDWHPRKLGTGFHAKTAAWRDSEGWQWHYIEQRAQGKRDRNAIPGLPPGYSVALEVHILDEVRILLAHQRSFRGGTIDPQYEWLDNIVRNLDGRRTKTDPRAKHKVSKPTQLRNPGPLVDLRPYNSARPLGGGEPSISDGLKAFTDSYGDHSQAARRNQVYEDNILINAFGSEIGLPKREEDGSWAGPGRKSELQRYQEEQEGAALDKQLEALLERTAEVGRGGSLVGSRLDR